jgi:PEP-CTERM motif
MKTLTLLMLLLLLAAPAGADLIEQHFTDASGSGSGGGDIAGGFTLTAPGLLIGAVGNGLGGTGSGKVGQLVDMGGVYFVEKNDVESCHAPPVGQCLRTVQLNGVSYDNNGFGGQFTVSNTFGTPQLPPCASNPPAGGPPQRCGGSVTSNVGTYTGDFIVTSGEFGGVELVHLTFEGTAVVTESYLVSLDFVVPGNDVFEVIQQSVVFGPIVTPEPSTWLLLGSGIVGLAFARKKLIWKH